VSASAEVDVDKLLPPNIESVSLFVSATAVPESERTFLNMFWLEPLSEFVIVTSISVPEVAPSMVIPEPSLKSNAFVEPKSCSDNALAAEETLIPGTPAEASLNINEPSASQRSVAKLYTIEC